MLLPHYKWRWLVRGRQKTAPPVYKDSVGRSETQPFSMEKTESLETLEIRERLEKLETGASLESLDSPESPDYLHKHDLRGDLDYDDVIRKHDDVMKRGDDVVTFACHICRRSRAAGYDVYLFNFPKLVICYNGLLASLKRNKHCVNLGDVALVSPFQLIRNKENIMRMSLHQTQKHSTFCRSALNMSTSVFAVRMALKKEQMNRSHIAT